MICPTKNKDCNFFCGGRHGHDCMIVGFTTTYVISAYHH